jgi:hypothetical protein
MKDPHHKVAFVVATKDRPEDLRTMLRSMAERFMGGIRAAVEQFLEKKGFHMHAGGSR